MGNAAKFRFTLPPCTHALAHTRLLCTAVQSLQYELQHSWSLNWYNMHTTCSEKLPRYDAAVISSQQPQEEAGCSVECTKYSMKIAATIIIRLESPAQIHFRLCTAAECCSTTRTKNFDWFPFGRGSLHLLIIASVIGGSIAPRTCSTASISHSSRPTAQPACSQNTNGVLFAAKNSSQPIG